MAPEQSTGSGPNASAAASATTAAALPTSPPKGKRSTGGASKRSKAPASSPAKPKAKRPSLTVPEHLLILQASLTNLAQALNTSIQVAAGTQPEFFLRLPKGITMCTEPDCNRMFQHDAPDRPPLYCELHQAAHSTVAPVPAP